MASKKSLARRQTAVDHGNSGQKLQRSNPPAVCGYCHDGDPDCGFCDQGTPLDTPADWDASWGAAFDLANAIDLANHIRDTDATTTQGEQA